MASAVEVMHSRAEEGKGISRWSRSRLTFLPVLGFAAYRYRATGRGHLHLGAPESLEEERRLEARSRVSGSGTRGTGPALGFVTLGKPLPLTAHSSAAVQCPHRGAHAAPGAPRCLDPWFHGKSHRLIWCWKTEDVNHERAVQATDGAQRLNQCVLPHPGRQASAGGPSGTPGFHVQALECDIARTPPAGGQGATNTSEKKKNRGILQGRSPRSQKGTECAVREPVPWRDPHLPVWVLLELQNAYS